VSRFFKSAAFPIVVVVVLAFFAQKMIIDNSGSKQANTWNEFTQAATLGKVQYLKTNLGDNSLKYSVTKADGSQTVTIGIPSTALMDQAISQAQTNNSNLVVDG
jgi:cell division protease FtsH